jgi:hypothetical protein
MENRGRRQPTICASINQTTIFLRNEFEKEIFGGYKIDINAATIACLSFEFEEDISFLLITLKHWNKRFHKKECESMEELLMIQLLPNLLICF